MLRRSLLLVASAACLVVACASPTSEEESAPSEDEIVSGELRARATDPCTATLVFLQKDAYKSTAGRSSDLWPPHTTTQLEVSCQTARGEQHIAPFKENYGTKPDAKDAAGNPILVKVEMDPKVVTVSAPWREMKNLVASYESCGCDPEKFLSLDHIDEEGQGIVEHLTPILSCPDGVDALLKAISEKRIDDAKRMAATCTLKEGVSPAQLASAAEAVQADVKKTLAGKHVCNNNAMLQADLFARFRDGKDATACSTASPLCAFPKLFYSPRKEAR